MDDVQKMLHYYRIFLQNTVSLPLQPKNFQNSFALLRSYSITFLVSKIQLLLTYVLELLYFLQHFPAKHSVPLQPKKIQKNFSKNRNTN